MNPHKKLINIELGKISFYSVHTLCQQTWVRVDKAKIEVIKHLPLPNNLKQLRGFSSHTCLYKRFIKDFSKISKPLTNLIS